MNLVPTIQCGIIVGNLREGLGVPGRLFLFVVSVLAMFSPQLLAAEEPIILMYAERAPYIVADDDGSISGLTASPAVLAFEAAGVSYVNAAIPTNRQLSSIKANLSPSCGIGWFDRSDRRVFAQFTKPIYRDRPTVVLMNRETALARYYDNLERLIANDDLTILVKTQFSYGKDIDSWLTTYTPNMNAVTLDNVGMLRMIIVGRADYMLMGQEEATHLMLQTDASTANDVRMLSFPDSPHGNYRHLMCSLSVPQTTIERLNQVIATFSLP